MPTPYEKVVPSFPTPNIEDAIYSEQADTSKAAYRPFNPGEYYPDQTQLPGYRFLMQEPIATQDGNDKLVRQLWVKDRYGQETYNAYRKHVQEDLGYPIFVRTSLEPRVGINGTPYTTGANLVPMGSLVGLIITNFGHNYQDENNGSLQVALAFAGGGGSGAEGYAIVSPAGVITNAYITNGGTGYTSAPTITAPGGGNDFAATGVIQPQDAVLVSEESRAADGQLGAYFLSVTRVYHTLPGPLVRQWVWDGELRMYVKVTKRIVASTAVPTVAPVSTPGETIEYQPIDANRYVEITSSIIYASGGSPPSPFTYPTVVQHYPLPNEILTSPAAPFIYYVWAINTNNNFDLDMGLFMNIREGFSGPFKGRVTEVYTFDPTNIVVPALTVFNPQAHNFGIGWWYASDSQATARIVNFSIPQTLHPEITLGVSGDSGSAAVNTITIPATTPTAVPQNSWITINFTEPRPYKFDLFVYRILEIYIPTLTP